MFILMINQSLKSGSKMKNVLFGKKENSEFRENFVRVKRVYGSGQRQC